MNPNRKYWRDGRNRPSKKKATPMLPSPSMAELRQEIVLRLPGRADDYDALGDHDIADDLRWAVARLVKRHPELTTRREPPWRRPGDQDN